MRLIGRNGKNWGSVFVAVLVLYFGALVGVSAQHLASNTPAQGDSTGILLPASRRVVFDSAAFAPGNVIGYWDKGFYVSRERETTQPDLPNVRLYDANGNKVLEGRIWLPEAVSVVLRDAGVTHDRRILAAGFATKADGTHAEFLALTNTKGKLVRVIRTNPFMVHSACAGRDGTVWAFGGERINPETDPTAAGSVRAIRQFDWERGQLGAYLPMSEFTPATPLSAFAFMNCTADRLIVYSVAGNQFIEFKFRDHSVRHWDTENSSFELRPRGLALTESGDVYTSRWNDMDPHSVPGLYHLRLDEETGTVNWEPVLDKALLNHEAQGGIVYVWGADGNTLVFSRADEGFPVFYWSRVSE